MARTKEGDGKDTCIRIRMSTAEKERLSSYAKRHYQTNTGVIYQALDLLYAQEEKDSKKSSV